jgi:DNA mismatch endonuclease (patch repair protein)
MERFLKSKLKNGWFAGVPPQRSRTMSAIRGKSNRSTELSLKMAFVRARVKGWVLHPATICGKPDFFFPQYRLAVFVDGCFWHGCPRCGHIPKTRSSFWRAKIERNRKRDRRTNRRLATEGIRVVRIWEHSLQNCLRVRVAVRKITITMGRS